MTAQNPTICLIKTDDSKVLWLCEDCHPYVERSMLRHPLSSPSLGYAVMLHVRQMHGGTRAFTVKFTVEVRQN